MPIRFPLGQVVATPIAIAAISEAGQSPAEFLKRHQEGDWGELPSDDKLANEEAIAEERSVLSKYSTKLGVNLYVITEADRSSTSILLREEY
jgi:hypothetical protein